MTARGRKLHLPPSRLPPWKNRTVFLHHQGLRPRAGRGEARAPSGAFSLAFAWVRATHFPQIISAWAGRAIPPVAFALATPISPTERVAAPRCSPTPANKRMITAMMAEPSCVDRHDRRKQSGCVRFAGQIQEIAARCAADALRCRLRPRIERRMGSRPGRPHRRTSLFQCTDPPPFVGEKAHPIAPLAGLTATARSGGHEWSKDRCPHLVIDGRSPGDRLVEDITTVRSCFAEAGLLPGIERARLDAKSALQPHLGCAHRAFRSQRSGLFLSVALPIRLHAAVV
jgi:hypothetical protein